MLFIHANLVTMEPAPQGFLSIPDGFLLTEGSCIAALGPMSDCPDTSAFSPEEVFDLKGNTLLPGFIDAHCHMGLAEEGLNFEGDDLNEITDPVTPQLRGIDAINPLNKSFEEAVSAAVTTVVTGPGSANAIGGQFCAVKTYGKNIDRMVLQNPVAMKFALGENPKNCYNDKSETPMTRMATAALIRESLRKAQRYYEDCCKAQEDEDTDPPDFDAKCDALVPVIKGELKAHFHCHRADDIFTAIRIAKEFGFPYVIVHGTEGHLVADLLAREGAAVIAGPLLGARSKPELKNADDGGAGALDRAGVKVAVATDHPELPCRFLLLSAQVAAQNGMDPGAALRAVTSAAAEICGLEGRVGALAPGRDADVLLYEEEPLETHRKPFAVFVDGRRVR